MTFDLAHPMCVKIAYCSSLKSNHGILQILNFDWFTGHGTKGNKVEGESVRENSQGAQILQ